MKVKLLILATLVAVPMASFGSVWYDHTVGSGFGYSAGNGDADGGANDFGSNVGLQEGQWVKAQGNAITLVQANYLQFSDTNTQAFVDVYDSTGATLIGSSGLIGVSKSSFTDNVFGLLGVTYTANVNIGGLTSGTTYLVAMQIVGGSWAYIARDVNGNAGSFGRDFSHFGYGGGYGTTQWTSMGNLGFGDGDTNMRVEGSAVPEPVSMVVLGVGLAGLAARKRRK